MAETTLSEGEQKTTGRLVLQPPEAETPEPKRHESQLSEASEYKLEQIGISWDDAKKTYYYGGKTDDDGNVTGETHPVTPKRAEKLANDVLSLEEQAKKVTDDKNINVTSLLAELKIESDNDSNYFDKNGKIIPPEELLKVANAKVTDHALDNGRNYASTRAVIDGVPEIDAAAEEKLNTYNSERRDNLQNYQSKAEKIVANAIKNAAEYQKGSASNPDLKLDPSLSNTEFSPVYDVNTQSCDMSKKLDALTKGGYSQEQMNKILLEYSKKNCASETNLGFMSPKNTAAGLYLGAGFEIKF